jgi:hypothetical protein
MDINKKSAFSKQPSGRPDGDFNFKNIEEQLTSTADNGETTKIYNPEPPRASGINSKIKVEISTALEKTWIYLTGGSAFIACMLFIFSLEGKKQPPRPELLSYIPYFAALAAVFILCRFLTDNYYIMHADKRKIFYHFKFFGIEKITPVIDFDNIYAIGVTGGRTYHKNREIWSYHIFMADKKGKFLILSDCKTEAALSELNTRARLMASAAGCVCAEAGANTEIRVQKSGPDKLSMSYKRFNAPVSGLDEFKEMVKGDYLKEMSGWQKIRIAVLLTAGAVIIISAAIYFPDIIKSFEPVK